MLAFMVHGSWCSRLSGYGGGCTEVRGSRAFVRRRLGVREREDRRSVESPVRSSGQFALGLSGLPRRRVPPGYEVPTEPKGSLFLFFFIWVFGVCVCVVRPRLAK